MIESFFTLNGAYFPITLFMVGILSGFVGAMGGPSGLVILPFLILSGFSPVLALGTARFAALFPWGIAVRNFNKAGQLRRPQLYYLMAIGVTAGVIGTWLVLDVDEKYVYPAVGVALIVAAALSVVKKDFGLISQDYGPVRQAIGYGLYFLGMIYGGFIGGGASVLLMFTLVSFMGYKMLEAHSTYLAVWIVMSVFSCALFMWNGQVDYYNAIIILISMSIGSHFGSRLIVRKGDRWVKVIVSGFACLVGLRLLWENLF